MTRPTRSSEKAKQGLKKAEVGDPKGAKEIDQAEVSDPQATEAVEQEKADGPPGRGLAR
jgi:hypothetical protein